MTRLPKLIFIIIAGWTLAGCATTSLNSEVAPGTDLSALKVFYVQKLPADGRGVERLISDRLSHMGYKSTYGPTDTPPGPVDAIVTYQDHWMWDITMYMLELDIQLREPESHVVVASGHSYRTSLVRKSPQEMVEEVLNKIFSQ